jgi:hypothetical protein
MGVNMENSCKLRIPIREGKTEGPGIRLFDIVESGKYEYEIEIKHGREIHRVSINEILEQVALYRQGTGGA